VGHNSVADIYGSIFIRLAVIASETREMSRNSKEFDLTPVQGHPRSSFLVSMESPYVTS